MTIPHLIWRVKRALRKSRRRVRRAALRLHTCRPYRIVVHKWYFNCDCGFYVQRHTYLYIRFVSWAHVRLVEGAIPRRSGVYSLPRNLDVGIPNRKDG